VGENVFFDYPSIVWEITNKAAVHCVKPPLQFVKQTCVSESYLVGFIVSGFNDART
jgi:hypothetical protein